MGTTADKLNKILETKAAIKAAIISKGVDVPEGTVFADYPSRIAAIQTGSGEGTGGASDAFFNLRTDNGTNFSSLFYCYSGSELDLSDWDTSQVSTMNNMFTSSFNLTSLNLSNWDTRKVYDMNSMFSSCSALSSLDLSHFNTSNVADMSYIFSYCNSLASLNLNNWDTRNVTNMNSMFSNCPVYSLDLNSFDTSNVNGMNCMFNSCANLKELNVSNFNTSNVNDMNSMFAYCYNLKSLDLSHFNTSSVTNIDYMFNYCYSLEELDIRNFNVNNIEYVNWMFEGCSMLHKLRLDNCGYDTINKIINSANFPTGEATNAEGYPLNAPRQIYVQEANATGLTAPDGWEFVYVESSEGDGPEIPEGPTMPEPEPGDETIPLYQFGQWSSKTDITEVSTMVTTDHTDLNNMFEGCTSLTTVNGIDQWDTSNVTDMQSMFRGCSSLTEIDVSGFNTNKVDNMAGMFCECNNLQSLDLSNFNTSNVRFMMGMFERCGCLKVLNLSNFDLTNATLLNGMFTDCLFLHTLRLDNCSNDTINKIITSLNFPTMAHPLSETRKIYVQEANVVGLTAPDNWEFVYVESSEGSEPEIPEIPGMPGTGGGDEPEGPTITPGPEPGGGEVGPVIPPEGSEEEPTQTYVISFSTLGSKKLTVNNVDVTDQVVETDGYGDTISCKYETTEVIRQASFKDNTDLVRVFGLDTSMMFHTEEMFSGCTNLVAIISTLDSSMAYSTRAMFKNCTSLTGSSLDYIGAFSAATDKSEMFYNCSSLTGTVPSGDYWLNGAVTEYADCFYNCTMLDNYSDIPASWGGPDDSE